MSDYTKTTNFTAKDSLPSGDPNKKILGSLFDTEFDALATASATKANKLASVTSTNNLMKTSASGDLVEATSISDDGTNVVVATGKTFKITDNGGLYIGGTQVTSTAAELNKLDGATVTTAEINKLAGSGTLWHSGSDGAGSGLDADLLDGVQGSAYFRSDVADLAHSFTSSGATGGNQGADTVNVSNYYVDGVLARVSGSGTTGSLTDGSGTTVQLTHGLGSDNFDFYIRAIVNSAATANQSKWTCNAVWPDDTGVFFRGGIVDTTINFTRPTTPSSGNIALRIYNESGTTSTITYYWTAVLRY